MNPTQRFRGNFGEAVTHDPANADIDVADATVVVMGKDLGAPALEEIAAHIRQSVEDGVARPVNYLTANAIAEPSGGLAPTGKENTPYEYKGEDMFQPGTPS